MFGIYYHCGSILAFVVCTIVYQILLKRKFALTLVVLQGLDIILLVFSFTSVTLMGNAR